MTEEKGSPRQDVFLSYSRNDGNAATNLHGQLERFGLSVFKDDENIRWGDRWVMSLQQAVEGCDSFVLLVGRDGLTPWMWAEAQAALIRHFGSPLEAGRLPIFPILLDGVGPEVLAGFLKLFQAVRWNGSEALLPNLFDRLRQQTTVHGATLPPDVNPFVGLAAYRSSQAHLFFGRHKETLDALNCFFDVRPGKPAVRWLEINGGSGSGKSSLMFAGLLPLVGKGWLSPTGYSRWKQIEPMAPGRDPVANLSESLARSFQVEMVDVRRRLEDSESKVPDDRALAEWLRGRKEDNTAFLLPIDQFEELFTFADPAMRDRFDRLLSCALADTACPLFVISTVRIDFLEGFADLLPRLAAIRNELARRWTLGAISEQGLREVVSGPARLAGLQVGEVQEAILADARDEPGALPLVENALDHLWDKREGSKLSRKTYDDAGKLAGILSRSADDLLDGLGPQRDKALELLFRLVRVDPEGVRHARQRIGRDEAVAVAGGGEAGLAVVNRLSGLRRPDDSRQAGPLRLITVSDDGAVNLIHETLIRSKGLDKDGKPQPYWPTLWDYIESHKQRAAWIDRLRADTKIWIDKGKRDSDLWSHERVREAMAVLKQVGSEVQLSADEWEFLGPTDPVAMLADLKRPETSHRQRALIGERLDILGDPREGVGIDATGTPEIAWCCIPGGEVTVSIQEGPDSASPTVVGTFTRVVTPFRAARYPITVTQYRSFIAAEDGWRNPDWWVNGLHRDPDGDSFEFGHFGNHPAVYISWFDAVAFCRWLSKRLGRDVRLPDEWEWQQLATGGDAMMHFPWAPEWNPKQEPHRANSFESRLGRVTAVGMYPDGASLQGLLDAVGTVWEWSLNKFDRPEVASMDTTDDNRRVLRGGSWVSVGVHARSDCRRWDKPDNRAASFGFRLVDPLGVGA